MQSWPAVFAVACLVAPIMAQDAKAPPPKRSLADGLVRQLIEREHLKPPLVESGQELGAGQGPMVLLVRRVDGALSLHEIERGAGDHGPAAEKKEAEVEVKKGEAAGVKKGTGESQRISEICIRRSGDEVAIGTDGKPRLLVGKTVDRDGLQPLMKEQFAGTRNAPFEGQLILRLEPGVLMQDVLTAWEVARLAGFTVLLFPAAPGKALAASDQQLVSGLAAQFGWQVARHGPQPICDGELSILLDGPARYEDVAPLLMALARAGIWQISFVGQKDMLTRFKLPTFVPFDRGR